MSNLANNVVVVNNTEILIKEWNGERVITFKEVDRSHSRCKGTARARFNKHRDKFINGVDYYATTRKELNEELEAFGIRNSNQGNPNIEMILLTKSGYLMLVKTFNDPEAWKVQRDLVNAYFVLENMFEQKGRKSNNAIVKSNVNKNNLPAQQKTEMPAVTPAVIHSDISIEIKNFLEYEQKKNEEFRETMMKGFAVLSTLIMNQNKMFEDYLKQTNSVQIPAVNNESILEDKSKENLEDTIISDSINSVPKRTPHKKFSEWKNEIMELIGNRNKNFVLSETYSYMTKKYGICWAQLEKDYYKENGCKPHNNLFLSWWMEKTNEACRNLTYSCVDTIIKKLFKTEEKVIKEETAENHDNKVVTRLSDIMPAVNIIYEAELKKKNNLYPVHNAEELKKLAEYLIKEIGDNSPYGVVFYRKFFRFVAAIDKIDWKSFEEKYRNEFNKHSTYFRVSNLMMMEHFKEVEQKCVNLFNKYVEENYTEFLKDVK